MSKWKNIFIIGCGVLLFGAVIISAFTLLRAGEGVKETVYNTPPPTPQSIRQTRVPHGETEERLAETAGQLTVYKEKGGWQLIENESVGFSIEIPSQWQVSKNTNDTALQSLYQSNENTIDASVEILTEDPGKASSAFDWAATHITSQQSEPLYASGVPGVRIIVDLPIEYIDGDTVVEEHIKQVHAVFIRNAKVIRILCETNGEDSSEYLETCKRITESFKFF